MLTQVYVYRRFIIVHNGGTDEFNVKRYPTQESILHAIDKLMGVFPIHILRSV